MSNDRVQAKDTTTEQFLTAIVGPCRTRTDGHPYGGHPQCTADLLGVPVKVVLAKAKRLIGAGVIEGCACGLSLIHI